MPEIKDKMVKSITISFDVMSLTDDIYECIIDYAEKHPGNSKLRINIKDFEHEFTLELFSKTHDITVEYEFLEYLKTLTNVEYQLN